MDFISIYDIDLFNIIMDPRKHQQVVRVGLPQHQTNKISQNWAAAVDDVDDAAVKTPVGTVQFKKLPNGPPEGLRKRHDVTRKDRGPRNFEEVWRKVQKKREALIHPELNKPLFPVKTHLIEDQIEQIDEGIIAKAKRHLNESIPLQLIASSFIANSLLALRPRDLFQATADFIGSTSGLASSIARPVFEGMLTTLGQAEQVAQITHSAASGLIPTTGYGLITMTFLTGLIAICTANALEQDKAAVEIEFANTVEGQQKLTKILHVNEITNSIENDIINKFLEDLRRHNDYSFYHYLTKLRDSDPDSVIRAIAIYKYALAGIKKVTRADVDRMIKNIASPASKRHAFSGQQWSLGQTGVASEHGPNSVAFPSKPMSRISVGTSSEPPKFGGKKTRKTRKTRKH